MVMANFSPRLTVLVDISRSMVDIYLKWRSFPYHLCPERHFPFQGGEMAEVAIILEQRADVPSVQKATGQTCQE